jgi:hypothetical protein
VVATLATPSQTVGLPPRIELDTLSRFAVLSTVVLFDNLLAAPQYIANEQGVNMKSRILLFTASIVAVSVVTAISFAQKRTDTAEKPITGDFKITIRNTTSGQTYQSTTMIRGKRERTETGPMAGGMSTGSVSVTQCDLRRTIQINDSSRKYLITPMESASGDADSAGSANSSSPSRRGGVVTMTVNTIDTGERKELFGFTARHLKRTMNSQTSPDACYQNQIRMETDGWYINLEYGLDCGESDRPPQTGGTTAGGCQDRYQFKRTGPSRLGYPLSETTTMYGADGRPMFTSAKEVVELSRQPLQAALFDVPAGYTEVRTQEEMSGTTSMADVMAMQRQQSDASRPGNNQNVASSAAGNANTAAKVRVGVVEFNNKTKASVSTDSLREQLIAMLKGNGVDAVALNASSPSEAAIEAKAKECAYVLYTDVATLKTASSGKKIGGLLGRAAGVGSGDAGKSEVRLEFRLVPAGSSSATVQSSVTSKEENDQASVSSAIENEAKAVASAVGKM